MTKSGGSNVLQHDRGTVRGREHDRMRGGRRQWNVKRRGRGNNKMVLGKSMWMH